MKRSYRHRRYIYQGMEYFIRDVIEQGRFVRCEYAVRRGSRYLWRPCPQGVEFSEIEALTSLL